VAWWRNAHGNPILADPARAIAAFESNAAFK